jgi:replicative DNA helicase
MENVHGLFDEVVEKIGLPEDKRIGVRTGFSMLDKKMRGLLQDKLYVFAARPGCGKTSFATSIMANMALYSSNVSCIMFSTEASEVEVLMQMTEAYSGGTPFYPNDRTSTASEIERLQTAAADLRIHSSLGFLRILYRKKLTMDFIKKEVEMYCEEQGAAAVVVIDQVNRIRRTDKDRHGYAIATEQLVNDLEELGTEVQCPLLCFSQMNRSADGVRPTLAGIKHSGAFEEFAPVVLLAELCEGHGQRDISTGLIRTDATIHVAKNRHGPVGPVPFKFFGESHTWREAAL